MDEVREIVEIDEGGITTDATTMFGVRADFLLGIAQREEGVYMVLDLPRVLGDQQGHPRRAGGTVHDERDRTRPGCGALSSRKRKS